MLAIDGIFDRATASVEAEAQRIAKSATDAAAKEAQALVVRAVWAAVAIAVVSGAAVALAMYAYGEADR